MNPIADMLNHKDEEIIEYLAKTMAGVVKNFNTAVNKSDSAILYANLGDISLVASVLKAMHQRNQNKLAMKQEQ